MSRIDVVPAEKNKFKVLVNFVQRGISFSTPDLANKEAKSVHSQMPHCQLNLIEG